MSDTSTIEYEGAGELHICDIDVARRTETTGFDRVMTVCRHSIEDNVSEEQNYSWHPMPDSNDAEYQSFEAAADELYTALANGERVLIHCHLGVSRSVAISTAALGRLLSLGRSDALDIVRRYRPVDLYPHEQMMAFAHQYIEDTREP